AVQFHPTLSYEDFIRGWRPTEGGKLELEDGHLLKLMEAAKENPSAKHVMIIEEINRGNPAQIFGEMLTLLEKDKRSADDALVLSYRRHVDERVFIPPNLYIIGTMNIADRSLALVDLALRRRFAFIDLKPEFNDLWYDWAQTKFDIDVETLDTIKNRMKALNKNISGDSSLGPQFQVGHSYVTPTAVDQIDDGEKWFLQIVETEIGPLLNEYWADAPGNAEEAIKKLAMPF
nr:AAA family ATPase [Pseudomonadota bacterium]